jgi:hypothetical protein
MYRQTVHIKKRLIDIMRTSNRAQFDFDPREFAEAHRQHRINPLKRGTLLGIQILALGLPLASAN